MSNSQRAKLNEITQAPRIRAPHPAAPPRIMKSLTWPFVRDYLLFAWSRHGMCCFRRGELGNDRFQSTPKHACSQAKPRSSHLRNRSGLARNDNKKHASCATRPTRVI